MVCEKGSKSTPMRLLTTLMTMLVAASASSGLVVQSTITGAGYKNSETLTGLRYLSMAGGAPILLKGLNFASEAASNSWKFVPLWMEGAEIWGPDMTSDDKMNSNDLSGRLAIVAPSAAELMGQDISMFNGEFLPSGWEHVHAEGHRLRFYAQVHNWEQGFDVTCETPAYCLYAYSRDFTPVMLDITPSNVCQGQEMHFHINARGAHTTTVTPADEPPYRSLHMGSFLLDTEEIIEDTDRLGEWVHDTQYAVMTDGTSTNSTEPKILFYNGLAMLMRGMTHCNFAGDDCWTVRVHPRIKKVSFNSGYSTGGQVIKIDGVSFNGTNIDVKVDGVNCTISDSDLDQITCVTGSSSVSSIGYQPGQPGLTQIQTDEDYNEYLVLATSGEVMNLNSSNPISGWFKAPETAQYRFYVSCDAACTLSGNMVTPYDAANISTSMPALDQLAYKSASDSWRNYHYVANDGHYSDWVTLLGGYYYYFSGTTNSQMSIGLEIRPNATYDVVETTSDCTCDTTTTTDTTSETTTDNSTTTETTTDTTTETTTDNSTTTTTETTTETTTDTSTDTTTESTTTDNSTESTNSTRRRLDSTCSCDTSNSTADNSTENVTATVPTYNGHHHATKQIQEIAYEHSTVREEWDIVITNPDSGLYKLNLLSPPSAEIIAVHTTYYTIPANGPAWMVRRALNWYYFYYYKCWTTVTKTMYDSAGIETTVDADAATIRYRVSPNIQIDGVSTTMIAATPTAEGNTAKTAASIAISLPSEVQQSTPPFAGHFAVTCTDNNGIAATSNPINVWHTGNTVKNALHAIPFLVDNFELEEDYDGLFLFPQNRINFRLHMTGIDYQMEPCVIASYDVTGYDPLTGNYDMQPNVTVLRNYGDSLFFPVVPLEMIHTDSQTPQILLTIDGMPALCLDMNCDFAYTASDSVLSGQVIDDTSLLTLTGTLLPNATSDIIRFGPTKCTPVTLDNSTITCQLDGTRVSGSWKTFIRTQYGLIPNQIQDSIVVPVSVSAISPATDINFMGGSEMTITGDNFGTSASAISVSYSDGTACTVTSATMTSFTCVNSRFATASVGTTLTVTVTVNGETDSSLTTTLATGAISTMRLEPSTASPVLKTEIVAFLDSAYPETLNASDFTAILYSHNDTTYERALYVMSVDDAAKSVKIKFPGAESGLYYLQLSSTQHGRLDSDVLQLDVHGSVTSFSPTQGSKYGGTLITILGENFGTVTTDNPVMIGADYCYVQTTNATTITCRTDLLPANSVGSQLMIVFLKTSEEAATPNGADLQYEYVVPSMEVTGITAAFSDVDFSHKVTVAGNNIDSTIELLIDGFSQELLSHTSTEAVFKLTNLNSVSTTAVTIYSAEGYPEGAEIAHSVDVAPSLLAIEPATGNSGGSKISVTGSGFGTQTAGLNLYVDGTTPFCASVEIYEYGKFYCHTITGVASNMTLDIRVDGALNADSFIASDVTFEQTEQIVMTAADVSGSTVTFTGTGFPTADFTASAILNGIQADSVTINSATSATAQWSTTGVPASTTVPTLKFISTGSVAFEHTAAVGSAVTFSKTLTVSSTSSGVECSFSGGCTYAIESSGLHASMLDSANHIQVCGTDCVLRTDLSDHSYAVCELPQLSTSYSTENYKIAESVDLSGTIFPEETALMHDGHTVESYIATGSTCEAGMTFKEGHVGVLDEAKIFINFLIDKTPYVNNLEFQGSNDGTTWTSLHTFGEELHEGWNYVDYRDDGVVKPAYNSYRFYGSASGACKITEYKLHGVEAVASTADSHVCTPKIFLGTTELTTTTPLGDVTYNAAKTPKLVSISPRFGSVLGGTTVTLTGENLLGTGATSVLFDNRVCTVSSTSATQIVCTTADKPYIPDTPVTKIEIEGLGLVATQGLVYRYVSLWSDTETWGGDIPPMEGESIHVPTGQHLLVDVDSTPILNAIIVEGSMIFAPSDDPLHFRTFDATFVMVNNGYFELGTEEFPYTSKMQMTMHATRDSPSFGIYGSKMIGCRFCQLSMCGIPKTTTWTRLSATAAVGATVITVQGEPDWNVGDKIVIAGTSWHFNYDHEEREIASISGSTITLTEALEYEHISVTPEFGGIEIPMQAEVGLLTRNVVFRGNPEDSRPELFGAHIMVHSPGDESSVARIHYIELTEAGQAFSLGRYAIHFHMIGTVHGSLVKGNAIHHSYNRACTTHGVHHFRVEKNVAFDTMGHSFFIEDAVETKCVYDGNLSVLTRASNTFLNTDQTPGAWWITIADNILINNAVAGSDAYGYWYDMQETGMGANFDPNICPEFIKLGEFRNNTVHGVRKYGLRIFHALVPRTYPCLPSPYDADYLEKGETDPYWQNPKIPAIFDDFVGYKCGFNGAITERTGAVTFNNFKVADNGIAGIEFAEIEDVVDGYAKLENSVIIGNSGLNDADGIIAASSVKGFIGPKTEFFGMTNVAFHNFDFGDSGALSTCSHCFHHASSRSGGLTYTTSGLSFTNCNKRIWYQAPFREIIHDLDGSLTGLGADSWAVFAQPHLYQPECQGALETHDGVICDSRVQVRRISFWNLDNVVRLIKIKIAQWDTDFEATTVANETALWDYTQDVNHTFFSMYQMEDMPDPRNGWSFPIVTGHRYRFHWGENLDWTNMDIKLSAKWTENDASVHLMNNFTDVRASINVTLTTGEKVENETYINKQESQLESGDFVVYNQTEVREFHFMMDAKNSSRTQINVQGYRCVVNCDLATVVEVELASDSKPWSDPASWPSGNVPVEGDEVEIISGDWIEFDIEDSPILKSLTINGRLTFKNDTEEAVDRTLHAWWVFVRAGDLLIGSEEAPYNGTATIKLYGDPIAAPIAFSMLTEGGNKGLFVVGEVKMYGQQRDQMSRLRATVEKGDKTATVYGGLDWKAGDQVSLLPTAIQEDHLEVATIESYDSSTGVITFTEELKFYHWGKSSSTGTTHSGLDMRGEVLLLTRNVRVVGNDTDTWGAQIVVSDSIELDGSQRTGHLTLDSVECYNCSQRSTRKSGIRIENAKLGHQLIKNSVVWGGEGWSFSIQGSYNVEVYNCNFVNSNQFGFVILASQNVTVDNVVVAGQRTRPEAVGHNLVDYESCVSICALDGPDSKCADISFTNSIAAGCVTAGFVVPGHDCGDAETQTKFRGNVAHSVLGGGANIFPDVAGNDHNTCYEGSHFSAYKVTFAGVSTNFVGMEQRMSNMVMADNVLGVSLIVAGDLERAFMVLKDSDIYGETEALDCPGGDHECKCMNKNGIYSFTGTHGAKDFHIGSKSPYPMDHIMSYGSWSPATDFYKVRFHDWLSRETACGKKQAIFNTHRDASDYIPFQNYYQCEFDNVAQEAVAFLMDPNPRWNNIDDCVGFPCTAPINYAYDFKSTTFSGSLKPSLRDRDWQIIPDNVGVADSFKDCTFVDSWNAWSCTSDHIGQLMMISDDVDQEDRSVTPIYIVNEETGYSNKLQHQMDHMWDGFYTGQKHKSQFSALIETNIDYNLTMSSTPPENMRFQMRGSENGQIKIMIQYWNTLSLRVYADDVLIDAKPFDKDTGTTELLTGYKGCGENRWIAISNQLEFILTPNCMLRLKKYDTIQSNVRLEWTMDEFYASGGPTSFIDRVSAALGIHASQMKVVAVYTGSVVVEYEIAPDETQASSDSAQQLRALKTSLTTLIESDAGASAFGAPVLSASTGGTAIIEDPTYNPAARPTAATQPITEPKAKQASTVTVSDEFSINLDTPTRNSLIGILVVLVLIVGCCFGCGTLTICFYSMTKATQQVSDAQKQHAKAQLEKKQGHMDASESQIEIDRQYDLDNNMDLDIFTAKKRNKKFDDDEVVQENAQASERFSMDSAHKMVVEPIRPLDMSDKVMIEAKFQASRNNAAMASIVVDDNRE